MKKKVDRDKINADIYDEINIIVDYIGLTDGDILEKSSEIDSLVSKDYTKRITPLTFEEIEDYAVRQNIELSLAAKRNSIEEDNSIRFTRVDNLVEIVIYRNFSKITLNYNGDIRHVLRDYFILQEKILYCLRRKKDFFKIQAIYLNKRNKIFCKSLYQVYRCFEKNVFGTFIKRNTNEQYILNAIQNKEVFLAGEIEFNVLKAIEIGIDNSNRKQIYMGQLDIMGSYNVDLLEYNNVINEILATINDEIFKIFTKYLSESFLNDMKEGKTSKLIGGFHIYE